MVSLKLQQDTTPYGLSIKTYGIEGDSVNIRHPESGIEIDVSFDDFCCAIQYFLTNTDLTENDPRKELIELIKKSKVKDDRLTMGNASYHGRRRR